MPVYGSSVLHEGLFGGSKPKKLGVQEALEIVKREANKIFSQKYKGKDKSLLGQPQYNAPSPYSTMIQVMLCPYVDCMSGQVNEKAQQLTKNFASDLDSALKKAEGLENSSAKFQSNMIYVTW